MTTAVVAAGIALGALAMTLSTPARAEPFNAKPGAWEMTVTATVQGNVVPAESLDKMTPEKRASVEKMMADQSGKPNTSTLRSCLKKEDLEQGRMLTNNDPKCTVTATTLTATKLAATRSCQGPPPSEGTMTIEAKSPESVVGTIDQQRTDGGKLHVDLVGRWLGASCKGIVAAPKTMP